MTPALCRGHASCSRFILFAESLVCSDLRHEWVCQARALTDLILRKSSSRPTLLAESPERSAAALAQLFHDGS